MVSMGYYHNEWLLALARVLCKNFRCRHYISHTWQPRTQHYIRIVGLAEDVAVCRDVYAYARQTAERLAKAYAKKPGVVENHLYQKDSWRFFSEWSPAQKAAANKEMQRSFLQGFCEGLEAKFREQVQRSESMALVLQIHPVVQDAYRDLGLGRSRYRAQGVRLSNDGAHSAGYTAGRSFEPRRPERIASPTPRLPAAR
jgi:hypothetical protein